MDNDPWKGNTFNFSCAKGEAFFHGILREAVTDPRIGDAMAAFRTTTTVLEQASDHRALAVVFALAIEGAVDSVLKAFAPGHEGLRANCDLTFSLKVEFVKSLALIPPHILDAIGPVRKIRNEFGHNLNIHQFDDLPRNLTDRLRHHLEQIVPDFNKLLTTRERLRDLTTALILALLLFSHHITMFRDFISCQAFRNAFKEQYPAALSDQQNA